MHPNTSQFGSAISRATILAKLLTFVVICAILIAPSHAQEFRASITGQVADGSGSVIPGASVQAVETATGQTYSSKSDTQGQYSLLFLLPGTYTVTVKSSSFNTAVFKDVVLESAQQRGLNVTLAIGTVNEEVVVDSSGVLLDTVSASTGGVIDQIKVQNMPSTGREVWDDVALTPGIRITSADPFDITPRNNGNKYAVAGVPVDANAFWVNGAPVSDQGSWYFTPEQDAAQEVQAAANPYDAQYGRTAGGAFNANIKAGTNRYHGAVYDFYGNEALNANFWTNDLHHIRNGLDIRNTFGGTIGGPIIRDKTFFFAAYEGFRQNYPSPSVDTVPQPQWLTGNFQGSGYTIYDPTTTTCVATGSGGCTQYSRTAFMNNTIPMNRISPIGQAILALYPAPTATGPTLNYAIPGARTYSYDQTVARVDQTLTQATRMYGLFTIQKNGARNPGNGFTNNGTTSSVPTGWDYNIILDLNHTFSASLVLDAKASYGHYTASTATGNALQNNFTASSLGLTMPANGSTGHQDIAPQFTMAPYTALVGNTNNGSADADADFAISLTQIIRKHTLHYGVEMMDIQSATTGIPGTPNGVFAFDQTYTRKDPLNTTDPFQGNAIADILLGVPSSGTVTWSSNTFVTYHYYGTFVQDTFRVRSNVSIEMGLRWDVNKSPSERHNRMNGDFCLSCSNPYTQQINYASAPSLQNPLQGGWTFAGVNGTSRAPYNEQWNDWQPRVGVAWTITPKTVARGGYGIFYSWPFINIYSNGFSQTTSYVPSLDGGLTPSNYFYNGTPYPNGVVSPTGASGGLSTQAGQAINYYNTDRKLRKTQHWSFGIQRELPWSVLVDAEYIGSLTSGMPVMQGVDVLSQSQQQACLQNSAPCIANVTNPFYGVLPSNATLGASSTVPAWELSRSYPLFNGITEQQAPIGKSHYNSGNIRVERKVKSLDFIFNYAYGNWVTQNTYLNTGIASTLADGTKTNGAFRDANLWSGLDPNDQRHSISANVVYPLPSFNKKGLVDILLNHWLVDSTILWITGTPLAVPSANLSGATGCTSYYPQGGQTRAHWFNNNVSCYQTLGQWQPRTTPLYIGYLRNPNEFIWNPAFHKQFPLPRGMYIQFRMEAVNGANHPTFGAPSLTLSTAANYTPSTSWTGFGTLPTSQANAPRAVIASLRVAF